jgi:hypothetical protein
MWCRGSPRIFTCPALPYPQGLSGDSLHFTDFFINTLKESIDIITGLSVLLFSSDGTVFEN